MKKLKILVLSIALTGTFAFGLSLLHTENNNLSEEKSYEYVQYMNRGDTW
ncbi:hypothetical protein B2J90_28960 (plasmid) [Bacillus tropicus]|nr:hypothetical protein B2J90_28960 [Bacillus cereus]